MAINIDNEKIQEYESRRRTWAKPGSDQWKGSKYAEGEEPPLQWVLDAALPFLIGTGVGGAYVGRKELGKQALKAVNKLRGYSRRSPIVRTESISGTPIVKGRTGSNLRNPELSPYLKWFGTRPTPAGSYVSPPGSYIREAMPKIEGMSTWPEVGSSLRYMASLPKEFVKHKRNLRMQQNKDFLQRLENAVKSSHKVKETALKEFPSFPSGAKWGDAWYHGITPKGTGQEYKAAGHAVKSMIESNPELKKETTDKVIDWLLKLD